MPERRATSATATSAGNLSSAEREQGRVSVLLPLPLAGGYDYLVPPELAVEAGEFVQVPLGSRRVVGVVWDERLGSPTVLPERLRPVLGRFEVPALPTVLRRFVDWVAGYTM